MTSDFLRTDVCTGYARERNERSGTMAAAVSNLFAPLCEAIELAAPTPIHARSIVAIHTRGDTAHRSEPHGRHEWDMRNHDLVASAANSGASNVTNKRRALAICGEANDAALPNRGIASQHHLVNKLMQQGEGR